MGTFGSLFFPFILHPHLQSCEALHLEIMLLSVRWQCHAEPRILDLLVRGTCWLAVRQSQCSSDSQAGWIVTAPTLKFSKR